MAIYDSTIMLRRIIRSAVLGGGFMRRRLVVLSVALLAGPLGGCMGPEENPIMPPLDPEVCTIELSIDNQTGDCLTVWIFDPLVGDLPIRDLQICESSRGVELPQGNYYIQSFGPAREFLSEVAVHAPCDSAPVLEVALEVQAPLLPTPLDMRWLNGEEEIVATTLHEHPEFEATIDFCALVRNREGLEDDFFHYDDLGTGGLRRRILENKEYLENFLNETFPEFYEALDGDVITLVPLEFDPDRSIERVGFAVAESFRGLNDAKEWAGEMTISQITREPDWEGNLKEFQSFQLRAEPGWRYGAVQVYEFHDLGTTPDPDTGLYTVNTLNYMQFINTSAPREQYMMDLAEPICLNGWLWGHSRFRLNLGPRTGFWTDWWELESKNQFGCLLIQLAKQTRGIRDFIRRKMMDLNGTDRMRFEAPGDGSFTLYYEGVYECMRELLVPR